MKTIVCLFCAVFIAVSLAEIPRRKMREYSDACQKETGISDENLAKARNHEEVDDPKVKLHAVCTLKKTGVINDDGEIQIETFRTSLNEAGFAAEVVEKSISKCAVKKDTPENTAVAIFNCVYEVRTKHAAHA